MKGNSNPENGSMSTLIPSTTTSKNNIDDPIDELMEESTTTINEENETWMSKCT